MATITLSNGRLVSPNLDAISHLDFTRMMKMADDDEEGAVLLGKIYSLSQEDMQRLSHGDWLRLLAGLNEESRELVTNPKSVKPSS